MKSHEDLLWITQVLLWNDERAFSCLMNKYMPQVRRYFLIQTKGNEATCDDLTQETFIRAWRGLNRFRQLSSFGTWLYRIAFNVYMSYAAQNNTPQSIDDETTAWMLANSDDIETTEKEEQIRRAIYRLNEKERQCITLFYLEDMKIKDIEKITGWPMGSIKSYLSRGRSNLEKILNNNE